MSEILEITILSLRVSLVATLISLLIGLPYGTWLALRKFRSRGFMLSLINTGMALPPVVVGLVVSILLWRSGPLGDLRLIYTPTAIIIAQTVIAAPVMTGLTVAALQQLNPRLQLQLLGSGCFAPANDLGFVERGAPAAVGGVDGSLWQRDLGSRRFHDGRREHPPPDTRADHGNRPGDKQRQFWTSRSSRCRCCWPLPFWSTPP